MWLFYNAKMPCQLLINYDKHSKSANNNVDWAFHSPAHFRCEFGNYKFLFWQLQVSNEEPLLVYKSNEKINPQHTTITTS